MRRAFLHTFVVFLYLLLSVLSSYATEFYFFFDIVSLNSLLFDWTRFDTRDHLSTFFFRPNSSKIRIAKHTPNRRKREKLSRVVLRCVSFAGVCGERKTLGGHKRAVLVKIIIIIFPFG